MRRYQDIPQTASPSSPANIALEPQPAAGDQPKRIRINAMLDLKDARGQRIRRVVVAYLDRSLHHDRPGVGFRNDEMDCRAGNLDAGAQRLTVRIEAGKDGSSDG